MTLTHLDERGRARMVDVGDKPVTARIAVAEGRVTCSAEAFRLIREAALAKGDVIAVSEIAGAMAAKRTAELIPLCHPLPLDRVEVTAELVEEWPGVRVTATVRATARTGVEMEALTAVAVACLTVYDMIKGTDREAAIGDLRVLMKEGGSRGYWRSPAVRETAGGNA